MGKIGGVLLIIAFGMLTVNAADNERTENKNVTVVHAGSSADGKSDISEKLLEECIVSLPAAEDLDAEVTSQSAFVKEINGDPNRNDFVKMFQASIEINYMLHQQSIIIVTTASIQGQEPVMRVVEKNLRQTKRFESNPTQGEYFAGRSAREYYFPTAEDAIADVKHRAMVWLKQQSAVVCNPKNSSRNGK